MTRLVTVAAAGAVALLVAGCTSGPGTPVASTVTHTSTVTHSSSTGDTWRPPRPAAVRPLPPGHPPRRGEKERPCPYIRTGLDVDAGGGVNLADLEGDRVYRATVLTRFHPIGCRFYFYAPPYEAIADIRPYTFATKIDAFNAMIRMARTGAELLTARDFVRGVTGVSFRTRYFAADGARDWAFAFAKGTTMVVVYTQRSDTSRNAIYIAKAIAGRF